MPRSPTGSRFNRPSFLQRFRCPLETCQSLLKSKSGWTRHIMNVHPDLSLTYAQSQNAIVNLSNTEFLSSQKKRMLYSSPPTSPMQLHAYENDYEIPPIEPSIRLSVIPSSPLPSTDEAPSHPTEYHAIINGTLAVLDSGKCCADFLKARHVTATEIDFQTAHYHHQLSLTIPMIGLPSTMGSLFELPTRSIRISFQLGKSMKSCNCGQNPWHHTVMIHLF